MVSYTTAVVGGLVATVAMTATRLALGDDSPPPTAVLWARFVGDEGPESYVMQGMVLHGLYGVGAAVTFVAALNVGLDIEPAGAVSTTVGLGGAVAYALVLAVVGAVVWLKGVLGMDPHRVTAALFALFHVVYGVVLGAFVVLDPL